MESEITEWLRLSAKFSGSPEWQRRLVEAADEIDRLCRVVKGEQEARYKSDAAYQGKDRAMSELVSYCTSKGVDLSHFFS